MKFLYLDIMLKSKRKKLKNRAMRHISVNEYQDKYVYCLEMSYFYYGLSTTVLVLSDPDLNVKN
jgi:hypothetical protein